VGTSYTQLTDEERIEIYALLKLKTSMREIARQLGRDHKTIREEIRRNSGLRGYRPKQAHAKAMARRAIARRPSKLTAQVLAHVEARLREDLSPDQVAATMAPSGLPPVSHERIYQHIWADKRRGGQLWKHLRVASGKRRRKRYGKRDWRGRIPGRVDIDQRPAHVRKRREIGHWEADLVSGRHHRGFLVTLAERKSRLVLIGHVTRKQAGAVTAEIHRLLAPHAAKVLTLTFDNGREFAGHQELARSLGCRTYFAKPYHSWERGTNENANGLIRQYFPKDMDLRQVEPERLEEVMRKLNRRPRKTLGYATPAEIFSMTH
jgi:IS30 family transposase